MLIYLSTTNTEDINSIR